MNIGYTAHATLRMQERDVTESQIIEVLEKSRLESHRGIAIIREYKGLCVVFVMDKNNGEEMHKILTVYRPDRSLDYKINKIPAPHDWWKSEGKKTFINQAHFLMDHGLTEAEVIEHLTEVYRAVCAEYGE